MEWCSAWQGPVKASVPGQAFLLTTEQLRLIAGESQPSPLSTVCLFLFNCSVMGAPLQRSSGGYAIMLGRTFKLTRAHRR